MMLELHDKYLPNISNNGLMIIRLILNITNACIINIYKNHTLPIEGKSMILSFVKFHLSIMSLECSGV